MTTWKRRLCSRRWIRAWFNSSHIDRVLGLIITMMVLLISFVVGLRINDRKHGDQGEAVLVIFGGFAAAFALMTLLPTRRDERWERLERRHWRRVERSLRCVELLEQRTADAEPVARDRSPVDDDEAP